MAVRKFKQTKRQLKPLLLDQTFLAGLGNIYTDESLHIAKLHPLVLSNSVTQKQARVLHEAIQSVLKKASAVTAPASIGCIAAVIIKIIFVCMVVKASLA
jgi:formamidopyrimidine-DNA glycosylase